MGQPAKGTAPRQRINVNLDPDVLAAIDNLRGVSTERSRNGKWSRSDFINYALGALLQVKQPYDYADVEMVLRGGIVE